MIEQHCRKLYRFLQHDGLYSRMGSLDYSTGKYENKIVFGEEEAITYAKLLDGKRNIFISRAARNTDGAVSRCTVFSLDIDPIRPKGEAATNEQHNNALNAGRKILMQYANGLLSSSGNGALLLYRIPVINDYKLHYAKEKIIIQELQKLVEEYNVKIDATNYSEAIVKFIGTTSTKGDIALRRTSRFDYASLLASGDCPKLLERLNAINVEEQVSNVPALPTVYAGDRSVADYNLVCFLKQKGASPAAALAALQANPLGRKTDTKDQERLINKIYGDVLRDEPSGAVKTSYFTGLFEHDSADGQAIKTGIGLLDETLGPLPKGEITTISARSGFGKSSIACTIAESLRRSGKKILYFSTEMEHSLIMHKFVSIACNIPLSSLIKKEFKEDEKASIKGYRQVFEAHPIVICDEFQPTIELVHNEIIKHKPDVIIFDHATQSGTHWENVAQFCRALKALTAEEKCVTLLLSQLNEPPRDGKGNVGVSVRGDVRGSQEIIFLSAVFMMLNNLYEVKNNIQPVELEICKNRYGLSGVKCEIQVDKLTGRYA